MSGQPPGGPQGELPLVPHDGTPLSFLAALRRRLDGFNPDRAQSEKGLLRPVIVAALERTRALDAAQFEQARKLFPGVAVPLACPMQEPKCDCEKEAVFDPWLAWQEPQFPLWMPNVAPGASGARGTPVSASSLRLSCNRGLSLFPTSVTPGAVPVALGFGMRGNSAPAYRKPAQ